MITKEKKVPIIIPSYEPNEKLITLLQRLRDAGMKDVILVDDGSEGEQYQKIFTQAEEEFSCVVLHHAVNQGKGRALKTAFNYCLWEYSDLAGVVTADADGQHRTEDMKACMEELLQHPDSLIMGCRNFKKEGVPLRSSFGNQFTSRVFRYLLGIQISDTQTGLRGIPVSFLRELLNVKGERFEFETNMLIETKERDIPLREVEIETIYLEENKSSHFHPIRDSLRIYAVFGKFLFSSLSSSVLDVALFALFCGLFRGGSIGIFSYIVVSTVLARICSAVYNFFLNYKMVFKSQEGLTKAMLRYALLAVVQMALSAWLVNTIYPLLGGNGLEIWVKIPIDVFLFFLSFVIQRELVYK